jgi:hypothetical protein
MALALIDNYLSDRFMFVSTNLCLQPILYGVPQGSVLGPKLFSLYINDLFNVLIQLNAICFADDTAIIFPYKGISELETFKIEISMVFKWFETNHLVLNYSKCDLVNFYVNKSIIGTLNSMQIGSKTFTICDKYKYLGIIIDSRLKFVSQYNKLISLFGYYKSIFKNIMQITNKSHRSRIYLAFVLPIIEYCFISYIHFSKTNFHKIEKLNKSLLQFTDLDIELFSLGSRLLKHAIKFLHNIRIHKVPNVFKNNTLVHKYNTRLKLTLPMVNKNIFKHAFQYWSVRLLVHLNSEASGNNDRVVEFVKLFEI